MILFLLFFSFVSPAQALMRPIFVPIPSPMMILNWEGVSTSGFDPEPKDFYDSLALPEQNNPAGGKGKIFGLSDKTFQVTCVQKGDRIENILCTIVVKKSDRTNVSLSDQSAEVALIDQEAALLHQALAGTKDFFSWKSQNGWLSIQSTPREFYFKFKRGR